MGILTGVLSLFSNNTEAKIKVGDKAPKVAALNQEGVMTEIDYSSGYTMIYFYPKADTPGCTAQACSLRDAYAELTDKGIRVYGVSTDSPEDQKKFQEKHRIPFTLLSDTDEKIAEAFGVPVRMGFASRQAFLIKDGVLVWLDRRASTNKQAQDILNYLRDN